MKKYIVIALIVLVGGVLLIAPLFKDDGPDIPVDTPAAASFAFADNLATTGDEKVTLTIEVLEELSELTLVYHDSTLKVWNNISADVTIEFEAGVFGVGTRHLDLSGVTKSGEKFTDNRFVRVLSDIVPEQYTAKIVKPYPHSPTSFTQGLEFANGRLFEGTGDPGNQGNTVVAEVDLNTGEQTAKMGLDPGYFGEGITILNNTLYQLTWQNQRCYTYDIDNNLQLKGEFVYTGEGWGLCNDGTSLIMSDGTERIYFRDPESFTLLRTMEVYNNLGPVGNLNELEYIDGKIYANVWTSNLVMVIDPETGKVLQQIDATSLVAEGRGNGEVLNGIAHDETTGKTYMTGKNWIKLFEVEFVPAGQ